MTESLIPAGPIPDEDSKFFWQGLRENKVLMQRCDNCQRFRFPPMPHCSSCHSQDSSVEEIPGRGSVYSWIVVNRAFAPEFAADVPYIIATVDFDEGVRAALRVKGSPEMSFGLRVRSTIHDHGEWSELRVEADV